MSVRRAFHESSGGGTTHRSVTDALNLSLIGDGFQVDSSAVIIYR
jgi:hypothetical protein